MTFQLPGRSAIQFEHHLLFYSLTTAIAALAYIPYSPRSLLDDALVVIIPLGVSLGLGLLTLRIQRREFDADQGHLILASGWAGTFVSATISGWMIALHYFDTVPIDDLIPQVLILVSVGLGAGVVVGYLMQDLQAEMAHETASQTSPAHVPTREHVLLETTWTNRPGPMPVLTAIVEALAAHEGADSLRLEPLSTHVNPTVFSELRQTENSQWQLTFYTREYEIRVSSLGTITVFTADPSTV